MHSANLDFAWSENHFTVLDDDHMITGSFGAFTEFHCEYQCICSNIFQYFY